MLMLASVRGVLAVGPLTGLFLFNSRVERYLFVTFDGYVAPCSCDVVPPSDEAPLEREGYTTCFKGEDTIKKRICTDKCQVGLLLLRR